MKQREMCDDGLVQVNGCLYVPYVFEHKTIEACTFRSVVHPRALRCIILYEEYNGG